MLRLPIPIVMLLLVSSAQGQRATSRPSTDPWEVMDLTNRPTVTLALEALNTLAGPIFQVRPVLLVRCESYELAVVLSTGSPLERDDNLTTPVRAQWGGGTQTSEETRWSRSTDSTSAFAPDPRGFLRQLVSNPDLSLEIHPSGRAAQVIRFNVRGLDRHMAQLDAACPPEGKGGGGESAVYAETMVDERPQIVSGPALEYPALLRHTGLEGRVTVQAVIDTLGRAEPTSVKVVERPTHAFDQSARDYVLHAVFRPGRVNGRAVRVRVRVPVEYKIQ